MKQLAEILKEKGLKVTPQRLAVYSALINTNTHPSAETIYQTLLNDNPSISLATVYKSAKLVKELNVCSEHSNYDADTSKHQHIVCTKCQRVFDIHCDNSNIDYNKIEEQSGFKIVDETITFYGLCSNCQKE